jgi:hypothetical protein
VQKGLKELQVMKVGRCYPQTSPWPTLGFNWPLLAGDFPLRAAIIQHES